MSDKKPSPALKKYIKLARNTSIVLSIVYILGIITIPLGIWHIILAANLSTDKIPNRTLVKTTAILSIFAAWSLFAILICVFFWHFNGILKDMEAGEKIAPERIKTSEPIAALTIAYIGLVVVLFYYIVVISGSINSRENTTISVSDTAAQLASSANSQTSYPEKIDSITTLTAITSSGNYVQYHETIAGADISSITQDALYSIIKPGICNSQDIAPYLQQGVGFQYIYTVAETGAHYTITVTNADCSS